MRERKREATHRFQYHEQVRFADGVVALCIRTQQGDGSALNPCQWDILCLLLAHPLLSDEKLAALLNLQRRSVHCSLYELHALSGSKMWRKVIC